MVGARALPESGSESLWLREPLKQARGALGVADKLHAHRFGLLHRAVSVFVFDDRGRLLLQRRSAAKYDSAALWSNTCCTHPRPGEAPIAAARRRLREEMGFVAEVESAFHFIYRAAVGELIEHEFDHVFFGWARGVPSPDPAEVAGWRWQSLEMQGAAVRRRPYQHTVWFRELLPKVRALGGRVAPGRGSALRR